MLVVRSCRSCLQATRSSGGPSIRRALLSSSRSLLDSPSSSPPPNTSATSSDTSPSRPELPKSKEISQLQIKLNEARHTAHLKLKTLLSTLDTSARKQGQALSAAVEAWELERKLRNVGGKINEATGYEEIERLRISVGDKGQFSCSHRIDSEPDTFHTKRNCYSMSGRELSTSRRTMQQRSSCEQIHKEKSTIYCSAKVAGIQRMY